MDEKVNIQKKKKLFDNLKLQIFHGKKHPGLVNNFTIIFQTSFSFIIFF